MRNLGHDEITPVTSILQYQLRSEGTKSAVIKPIISSSLNLRNLVKNTALMKKSTSGQRLRHLCYLRKAKTNVTVFSDATKCKRITRDPAKQLKINEDTLISTTNAA